MLCLGFIVFGLIKVLGVTAPSVKAVTNYFRGVLTFCWVSFKYAKICLNLGTDHRRDGLLSQHDGFGALSVVRAHLKMSPYFLTFNSCPPNLTCSL